MRIRQIVFILCQIVMIGSIHASELLSIKDDHIHKTLPPARSRVATNAEFAKFYQENINEANINSDSLIDDSFEGSCTKLQKYLKLSKSEQMKGFNDHLRCLYNFVESNHNLFDNQVYKILKHDTLMCAKSESNGTITLEPFFLYFLQIVNPIIKNLVQLKNISLDEKCALIMPDNMIYDDIGVGFNQLDETYYPFYVLKKPYVTKHNVYFSGFNVPGNTSRFQNSILIKNNQIIKQSGLIISYRNLTSSASKYIRIQAYYGADSQNPYTVFHTTVYTPPEIPLFILFDEMLNVNKSMHVGVTESIQHFIPMPDLNAQFDCTLIQYIIIEQWLDEWHACQKQGKKYQVKPNQLAKLDYLLLTLEPNQNNLLESDFRTKAEFVLQSLKSTVCENIQREQQARSKTVSEGKVVGKIKHKSEKNKGTKNKGKKKKASAAKSKVVFDDGWSDGPKKSEKFDVNAAFDQFKIDTAVRYRDIIKIFQEIDKLAIEHQNIQQMLADTNLTTTQKGSHITFHDSLGNFTLVRRHGSRLESQPHEINPIIMRRLQGLQHSLGLE